MAGHRYGFIQRGSFLLAASAWLLTALYGGRREESRAETLALPSDPIEAHLEKQEELEKTIWPMEIEAQRHEQPFIRLWDDLRNQGHRFAVLAAFPLNRITLGQPGPEEDLGNGVRRRRFQPGGEPLGNEGWRKLLGEIEGSDVRLVQSEWHHSEFRRDDAGICHSKVSFEIHAQKGAATRFLLKGKLHVAWLKQDGGEPRADSMDILELYILSREGEPAFAEVGLPAVPASFDTLAPELRRDSPEGAPILLLRDLDGDGLSEIVLPAQNALYRNRGGCAFSVERLAQQTPPYVAAALLADMNGDGRPDLVLGGSRAARRDATGSVEMLRPELLLMTSDPAGGFQPPRLLWPGLDMPSVLSAGDLDGDGDNDLFVGQYLSAYYAGQMPTPYYDANDGYPCWLLLNEGPEKGFRDGTPASGLQGKRQRRTYSASFADLNGDNRLDLITVNDFAGADLYWGEGAGLLKDVSGVAAPVIHAFGMSHALADFNGDGFLDIFVTGMSSTTARRLDLLGLGHPDFPDRNRLRKEMAYGNRILLGEGGGRYHEALWRDEVARSGWSWGCSAMDFDNNGRCDLYIANGHLSRKSAADYCTHFWRDDIYLGDSHPNAELRSYFGAMRSLQEQLGHSWNGFEHNQLLVQTSGAGFINMAWLMGVALEQDCRSVVSDDLDADGRVDLLVFGAEPLGRQTLRVFRNVAKSENHWIGVRLKEGPAGKAPSPFGASVTLDSGQGRRVAVFVSGDSFTSQHALTRHFGLGAAREVKSLRVVWPGGRERLLLNPEVDRYYELSADRN